MSLDKTHPDFLDLIFHEKQEGQLCAKHCLNSLLQGPYFTEVDLASIAKLVDDEEKKKMAEGGENREGYLQFIASPSSNMDDSGYFSIQVIANALKVWNLDLIPYKSKNPIAEMARIDPTSQKCYICNYRDHWFTIRKIGQQWFNLNSLLNAPELISDTYLSLFLAQLITEGYSIFIVTGDLPSCESDKVLSTMRVEQKAKPRLDDIAKSNELREKIPEMQKIIEEEDQQDTALQRAIQASLQTNMDEEQRQIQAAIAMSLEQ